MNASRVGHAYRGATLLAILAVTLLVAVFTVASMGQVVAEPLPAGQGDGFSWG